MPEHVHLLVSEPGRATLAEAIHYLKLPFAKRLRGRSFAQVSVQKKDANLGHHQHHQQLGSFWQKRYYDRNVRDAREFGVKLRYLHRNPVKRGLVEDPGDWKWSSFRHYAFREIGVVEIESEWTARDRELRMFGGASPESSSAQVSVQTTDANLMGTGQARSIVETKLSSHKDSYVLGTIVPPCGLSKETFGTGWCDRRTNPPSKQDRSTVGEPHPSERAPWCPRFALLLG